MSHLKIDKRISDLTEICIFNRTRSMFFILGENYHDQVVYLHHLLVKFRKIYNRKEPSVLWCFKKELGFNLFHNKKLKKLKKNFSENDSLCSKDVFQHFLTSSDIQVCHLSETDRILGQTFGLLIIQDFNAISPNTLGRIIESVEGAGMIIFLLPNITSLEELFDMPMDVHARYVTEAYRDITPYFNKRFVLSLLSCRNCLVLNDSLEIKLLPKDFDSIYSYKPKKNEEGNNGSNAAVDVDLDNYTKVLNLCCTSDQSDALKRLTEAFKDGNILSVVSLTSGRGRGKSAVLGLAVCLALHMHLSNIYVTSPHLENVQTLFTFLIKGLETLDYVKNKDFKVVTSCPSAANFISGVHILNLHRQTASYLSPLEFSKLGNAHLVVIDEAAAIPSSIVKKWIGPYNVCMASTINGYEGTGRSLSLKLINQLRSQSMKSESINQKHHSKSEAIAHSLKEISLKEAIRYSEGDAIETWLNDLLCLDASEEHIDRELPEPEKCQLYCINKEALFSYNTCAEKFLQRIVSLFVTSHYKNSPNDLMMMSDAPAHQIFCLLPPVAKEAKELPFVLCVIQLAFEGKISAKNFDYEQSHGRRASGDLIPWIISQQFQDDSLTALAGARVVRIATHPDCQSMGYGRHALQLLCHLYDGSLLKNGTEKATASENEEAVSDDRVKPLLLKINQIRPEPLDYIGVSYGLTSALLKFWKRSGFVPLYIRQTTSDVTGEHSCVMIKSLQKSSGWLSDSYSDFCSRFVSLLPSAFSSMSGSLALSVLHCKNLRPIKSLPAVELKWFIGPKQLRRLEAYCNNLIDHHLILDLLPGLSKLYFSGLLNGYFLSSVQEVILLCMGSQNKSVETTSAELNMEAQQVMGCFRKAVKKILSYLNGIHQNVETVDEDKESEIDIDQKESQKRKLSSFSEALSDYSQQAEKKSIKQERKKKKHQTT